MGGARLRSGDPEETRRIGELLGRMLAAGDVVLLTGALGAGKTAFTQGIGAGLGVAETINSPTFTIVKEYAGRLPLHHFDLYRIDEPDELYSLGFEEYFGGDGVAVVEWAERGKDQHSTIWPADWLRVTLRADATHPNQRMLDLAASGARGRKLLADFLAAVDVARREGAANDGVSAGDARDAGAATEGV